MGRRGVGPDRTQFYVDSLTKRQVKNTAVNLNFDMVGSPNFVRFVYDGDASDTDSLASTGSGVVEDVFVDYFGQGLASEPTAFDGRSTTTPSSASGSPGRPVHGRRGHQDPREAAIYGGTAGVAYDSVLSPGVRRHRQPVEYGAGSDVRRVAHGTLTFAQTGSVEGSDKGKALGHGDYSGSHLRK